MKYSRAEYERFLNTEIETQIKGYEQVINTKAVVLKEQGEVFVGRFLKIQPNGQAVFKVRRSDNMPRKNSFWTATYFVGNKADYNNWGESSWLELRESYQRDFSDANCVWLSKSDDDNFCLIGIKGLTISFAKLLEQDKPIIAFGPQDPPLQYLYNLLDIVNDKSSDKANSILDFTETENRWNPLKIHAQTDLNTLLKTEFENIDNIVIQGPPGTGKTYRMAKLATTLLNCNKSVLVTALTNQALIELAKKEDIKSFLDQKRVSKSSLTVDELGEVPKLQPIIDNKCDVSLGRLSLATFYVSSGWAKDANVPPYDYVIMDEASQALLPMIAASMKLGKKIVWVGDQNQLPPIVLTNEDLINRYDWVAIVKGFETICCNFNYKSYMLCDTFRLTKRGAESTGVFYNNELRSVAKHQMIPNKIEELNPKGGPILLSLDLQKGNKSPVNALEKIFELTNVILHETPKAEIAILTKFKDTVRHLQKHFVLNWSKTDLPDNIRIETVDRVQGLTVDYCFYLIPNASLRYSLEKSLFNVATSRAKYNTILVSDKFILRENMPEEVRRYLLKAQEDKFATFKPQTITAGNIAVNVVDKIDLSQFEHKRKEIVEGKENIYIIDTNVFVSCPDIITRIGTNYKVVVPAKVLEELDKLKLKADIDKQKLSKAIRNINIAFTKNFSKMEDSDVSLLPASFDKSNPDCMILSVALKHKNDNPILLTSDNNLQSRAIGLGIKTISLKEFLKR